VSSDGGRSVLALEVPPRAGRLAARTLRRGGAVKARLSVVAQNNLQDRARRRSVVRVAG
jgi:hypothetical protein